MQHPVADPPFEWGNLSARSPRMRLVLETLARLSASDVTVTLLGETGTGKDVLAQTLHDESSRRKKPFVVFDCGATAQNLVESELFGHERGAFTGAVGTHLGAFERAHGGTLFLDEIGDMPLALQPRLLRALETRQVRRVGGGQHRVADVRVVAATHRDLSAAVEQGRFRRDLYFRLAAAVVLVPPLRERAEDFPTLVEHILAGFGRPELRVAPATLDLLISHSWPGNVRELKNALGCAVALLDPKAGTLQPQDVKLVENPPAPRHQEIETLPLGGRSLESLECAAIHQTLQQVQWNREKAAHVLGIPTSKLEEKIQRYSLTFRAAEE